MNEDGCFRFDLTNENHIFQLKELFLELTKRDKLEGVVIKPDRITEDRVVPYMKVRNPDYLTLIYGFDYREESVLVPIRD